MYGRLGLEQAFIPGQGLKCPIKRKEKKEIYSYENYSTCIKDLFTTGVNPAGYNLSFHVHSDAKTLYINGFS
jgi:hypothetical protein